MIRPLTIRRQREIASLARKKYRERYGQMLAEGVRSVEAAVRAGAPVVEILVTNEAASEPRVVDILRNSPAAVHVLSAGALASLTDVQTSQGIAAVVSIERIGVEELVDRHRILMLDGIQDPGNAGTLVRSAAWFGVDAIVAGTGTVDLYNPKVVRAAMGGLWDLPQCRTEDAAEALALFRKAGFSVYGADLTGAALEEWRPSRPAVLVLGSEAHGLSGGVRELVDQLVKIPGSGRRRATESLNVAVAGGILLHEWTRRHEEIEDQSEKTAESAPDSRRGTP